MILQKAPGAYDALNEQETRDALQAADDQNVKKGTDIIMTGGRAGSRDPRIVLRSEGGFRFFLEVADDGTLTAVAL